MYCISQKDIKLLNHKIAEWAKPMNQNNICWISFLSCPIDLIVLTFSGNEFHRSYILDS